MKRLLPAVLPAVLAVSVLAGCTTTTSGRPPAVATRTVTGAAPATVVEGAERIAALACNDVLFARSEPATGRAAPLNQALGKAGAAALLDRKWADLTSALGFVAALPATGVSADDQTKADRLNKVIDSSCGFG